MIEVRGDWAVAGSILKLYVPPEDSHVFLGENPLLLGDGFTLTISGTTWRGVLRSITRMCDDPKGAHLEIELLDHTPVAYKAPADAAH